MRRIGRGSTKTEGKKPPQNARGYRHVDRIHASRALPQPWQQPADRTKHAHPRLAFMLEDAKALKPILERPFPGAAPVLKRGLRLGATQTHKSGLIPREPCRINAKGDHFQGMGSRMSPFVGWRLFLLLQQTWPASRTRQNRDGETRNGCSIGPAIGDSPRSCPRAWCKRPRAESLA